MEEIDRKLSEAVFRGDYLIAKALLAEGANANCCLDKSAYIPAQFSTYSPLMLAAKSGSLDCIKLLVEMGADINYQGYRNTHGGNTTTALKNAATYGHLECVKFLVDKGADLHQIDKQGRNILASIAYIYDDGRHSAIVDFLIARKIEINIVDEHGETALMKAVKANNPNINFLKKLSLAGVDMFIRDKNGEMAIDLAEFYSDQEITQFISSVHENRKLEMFIHGVTETDDAIAF